MRKSVEYRLRASKLARQAREESDSADARASLQQAIWWIQLAENEEWLISHSLMVSDNLRAAGKGDGASP